MPSISSKHRLISIPIACVLAYSVWIGMSIFQLEGVPRNLAVVFAIGFLATGYLRPGLGILLFMLLLPVFGGNRPSMPQTVFFYQVFSALLIGTGLRWLPTLWLQGATRSNPASGSGVLHAMHHPTALFLALFFIAGLFSLSSLPYAPLAETWASLGAHKSLGFISSGEGSPLYPLLTMGLQAQCAVLFLLIIHFPAEWQPAFKAWLFATLAGLLVSLAFGLLDYYSLINLRALRPLDPLVNAGDVQGRLQSFFGHSGWYAQYLTLAIPFGLLVLTLQIKPAWRIAIILAIMVLAEYVLILTYQRGGWLSYPVTVAVIWFCIYALKPRKEGAPSVIASFRKSSIKILVSIPLTIAASLALLSFVDMGSGAGKETAQYVERFKDIGKTNDRTRYIPIALNLVSLHPIYGGGSESFAFRYTEAYLKPGAPFAKTQTTIGTYYGSAHNVYLQTLTGKGIVGLLTLIGFLLSFPWVAAHLLKRNFMPLGAQTALNHDRQIVTMLGLSYAVAFGIYGNVQEIFYIPSLTVIMFFMAGIFVHQVPASVPAPHKTVPALLMAAGLLFVVHLVLEYS